MASGFSPSGSKKPRPVRLIRSAGAPISNAATRRPARHASARLKHQVSGKIEGSNASVAFCALISCTASSGAKLPVMKTRPVASSLLSSMVWPTTTNSSGRRRSAASRAHSSTT